MFILKMENKILFSLYISIFIFLLTFSYIGVPIKPGLDPAYQFAFNYFFYHSIQIGKDILFTYGPFGFINFPQPIGNNLLIANIIHAFIKFLFIFFSIYLNILLKGTNNKLSLIFIILLTSIIVLTTKIGYILIFLPVLFLLIYKLKNKIYFFIFANIIVSFAFMVKAAFGIIGLSIITSYLLILFFSEKKKSLFLLFISIFTLVTSFLLIWFLLYANFEGVINYIVATVELSKGNSTAMTRNPENNWFLFLLFLIFFFSIPILFQEKFVKYYFALMIISNFFIFKYSFSRADASHLVYFLYYLAFYFYLLLLLIGNINKKFVFYILTTFLLFVLFIGTNQYYRYALKLFWDPFITNLSNKLVISFDKFSEQLKKESNILLTSKKLEKKTLELISSNTIDFYPWDVTYAAVNHLNWKPRPVFQSYIAYTPFLDRKNAEFLNSKKGPNLVLIEKRKDFNNVTEIGSIDKRYLLNDEPLTILQLLNHYKIQYKNKNYILLKKSENSLLKLEKIIPGGKYKWNQWIKIPENLQIKHSIFRAKVYIKRSLLQKMKKFLYKEFEVFIVYKLKNGKEKKYRLVVDNAKNGLWIYPFQEKLLIFNWNNKVSAIKFEHKKGDFFSNFIDIKWEVIDIINPIN